MPKHSKYSSWAQFSKEVGGILWAFGKEWSDDFDDDSMLVEETLNILATYINKEKAKAVIEELEDWAESAIDSKPTQYDFRDRIVELEAQRVSEDK